MSNKAANNLRQSPLDKSCSVVNTVNTSYLGQCKVVEDKTNTRFLLLKEMVYNAEEDYNMALLHAQLLKCLTHDGLLYVVDYSGEKVDNFCSSFYNLKLYMLPHLHELRKLALEREKTRVNFSEKEMTYLLFYLTEGLAELHKAGFIHKQVSPESVDTTNLEGRNPKLIFFEGRKRFEQHPSRLQCHVQEQRPLLGSRDL
jgi:serine/threonine protein kinase